MDRLGMLSSSLKLTILVSIPLASQFTSNVCNACEEGAVSSVRADALHFALPCEEVGGVAASLFACRPHHLRLPVQMYSGLLAAALDFSPWCPTQPLLRSAAA